MEEIRVSYRLVVTVMCFVCLGFSVGMCSESDALIKTYVSSSLPSDDIVNSTKLKVPTINERDWDSLVLGSEVPVMVMFTAEWCGPCRVMEPILNKLDSEFTGRFKFYRVDIDEEVSIAQNCGIRALPTIIVFKGGDKRDSFIGPLVEWKLRELVKRFM